VLSVINFSAGGDDVKAFATFDRFRQGVPRMCGELWVGWFDHWGEPHHVVAPEKAVQSVTWMLERGISFNIYMLHGGTTFGFMAGANSSKTSPYHPDTSSYDYDSPLDEAGRPTPKFHALRAAIQKFLPAGEVLPEVPASAPTVEIPPFALEEGASLFSLLGRPVQTERPQPMEAHDQAYGFVLYRKRLDAAARGTLDLGEVRDYALVLQGDRLLGTLDRRRGEQSLEVELTARAPLDLLVENMGRINFGARLVDDRKGLVNPVTLAGVGLTGWEIYALPLDDLEALRFSPNPVRGPAFYRGSFTLEATGDTFLDLRGWGKGHAWVNGHHLGRYWRIGPQQSLFIPGSWIGAGTNEVVILDVEEGGRRTARGLRNPVFETP
jgi:beta-galactosidase